MTHTVTFMENKYGYISEACFFEKFTPGHTFNYIVVKYYYINDIRMFRKHKGAFTIYPNNPNRLSGLTEILRSFRGSMFLPKFEISYDKVDNALIFEELPVSNVVFPPMFVVGKSSAPNNSG